MLKARYAVLGAVAALPLALAVPAQAQKSKDTARIAITDMFSVLDPYHFPLDEAGQFYRTVYETLISYDERKGVYVPRLAKAWRRIDARTIEFDLRDDAKFHNGNKFDAQDVKHTIDYLGDPKVRIRFKGRYNWIEKVEVLGPYKVRLVAKTPRSTDMSTIAYRFYMYDKETHESLENPADYGRLTPVTTGPYKVVSIDPHKGMVLERFDGYYGDKLLYRAPIKRVIGLPMSDKQTQVARFLTGELEIMRNPTADNARELAKMPGVAVTPVPSGQLIYVTLDKLGRSDNKIMTDVRVRKAVAMAIDRQALARTVIPGGESAEIPKGICFKVNIGCNVSVEPYPFDPEQAKKLLAEAGYGNGVDLELDVHAPIKQIGEAIAGMLREVGFRTTIRPLPLSLYVKMRGQGKFTAFNGFYPTAAQPDVDNLFNFFFGADRDYWNDPLVDKVAEEGELVFDDKKRGELYRPALNKINQEAYIIPISELPIVYAHTKDVKILPNPLSALESRLGDFAWAN